MADILSLVSEERALRKALLEVGPAGQREARRKASRLWFAKVSEVMNKYAALDSIEPAPKELFAILASIADDLGRGNVSQLINDVKGSSNRNQRTSGEANAVAYATAYIQMSKANRIPDRRHAKTVSDAYGVERQTAQKWGKEDLPSQLTEYLASLDDNDLSVWLRNKISHHGAQYRKGGRSTVAISSRDDRS